ncbi:MAG: cell division protein FtsZ, partial [Mesorhizobium sp.]
IFDQSLAGKFRVSVVATGLRKSASVMQFEQRIA